MATSVLPRLALRTTRLAATVLHRHIVRARPIRQFSLSCTHLADKRYSKSHEWVSVPDQGNVGTVGISNHAQESLGEVVYVELPDVGDIKEKDDVVGCVESVKAASDLNSPVSGTVVEVNEALQEAPGLINSSPDEDGWLFKLEISDPAELETLMDEKVYEEFVKQEE